MQIRLNYVINFALLLLLGLSFSPVSGQAFPDDTWGVYTWASYNSSKVTPAKTPNVKGGPIILKWSNIEPKNGEFKFQTQLGTKLQQLYDDGYYTTVMVWVAPATTEVTETDTIWNNSPKWLFQEGGVPLVKFEPRPDPLGKISTKYFPYYLHDNYKFYFHRMIAEFGKYVKGLPVHLRERILFVQSAEGSTGDGGAYKGDPIDSQYNISNDQWSDFRIETWEKYVDALSQDEELLTPLLTNYDANRDEQYNWMLDKLPKAAGLKNGMFSHGYHISDAQQRLRDFNKFRDAVEAQGKVFFARGEQDAEYKTYGWSTQNIPQGLYWSGIYATHCGLTLWNVPTDACQDPKNQDALLFFNRHAAQHHPEKATHAFCALRRGLDASDTANFPVAVYGTASKSNTQRYTNITNAFNDYGAKMGDVEKATGGGMINRKRQDYNDAGWQILPGNYQRHITQIDPEETSVAWWHVDRSIYGRFARGFEVATNKNTMYFDVDDKYFEYNRSEGDGNLTVKIIHYAKDGGSWELQYHAKDGTMKSMPVTNDTSKDWVITEFSLTDALLNNGGEKGADLILKNTGNTNCRFHIIDLTREVEPAPVSGVSIWSNSGSFVKVDNTLQLEAKVSPSNAGNKEVTWTSLNPEFATVDDNGLVTAKAIGTATIKVTTVEGGYTATFDVEVKETIPLDDFVTIIAPVDGEEFVFGQPVTVKTNSNDNDGIERMRFKLDGSFSNVAVALTAPYEYTYNNLSIGTHTIAVQMKDLDGNRINTDAITIEIIQDALGVDDLDVSDAKVYPNPVENSLNLDFATNGKHQIKLFNVLGQLIYSVQTNSSKYVIDMNELNIKGLVIVEIKTGNSVANHKVIVK